MKKRSGNFPTEKTQEDIYLNLSRLLSRMDVSSTSYKLSAVAMQCEEKLLEEFLNDKPASVTSSLKDFLQSHLYTASFWGFPDVANVLIGYGADVNHRNKDSLWTPLHAACFQENEKVVELLLKKGASVRSKDRSGRTCIDIASVSPKIWPYFQELKCDKVPENDLIRKGLLKQQAEQRTVQESVPSSARSTSSSQMKMLLGGDNRSMSSTTSKISSLQLG